MLNRAFVLLSLLFASLLSFSQENDSLWNDWNNTSAPDTLRLNSLSDLMWNLMYEDPDSTIRLANSGLQFLVQHPHDKQFGDILNALGAAHLIKSNWKESQLHFERAFEIAQKKNDAAALATSHNNLGSVFFQQKNLPEALHHYTIAQDLFIKVNNRKGQAKALNNLGLIFSELNQWEKALECYNAALEIKKELNFGIGSAYINIGNALQQMGQKTEANNYYLQALEMFQSDGDKWNEADAFTELASVQMELKNYVEAIRFYNLSLETTKKLGNPSGESYTLTGIGKCHYFLNQLSQAENYCQEGLQIASSIHDLANEADACDCLYLTYKAKGNAREALRYKELHDEKQDSLKILLNSDEVSRLSLLHEFELRELSDSLTREEEKIKTNFMHEAEMTRKSNERNIFIICAVAILIFAVAVLSRLRFVNKTKKVIQAERERSDTLLLNILPESVARELKDNGKAEVKNYNHATVLFTDFQGFTELSEKMAAADLIEEVDTCFRSFDMIIQVHGLEKIKTIGDAYMAVAGLPENNHAGTFQALQAAIEMMDFVETRYAERSAKGLMAFRMRIGLHTGPVIAGVVGLKKFQYDIWGDTVNTAARMESASLPGKINISEETFARVKDEPGLAFVHREKTEVKGKGLMSMHFVEQARS